MGDFTFNDDLNIAKYLSKSYRDPTSHLFLENGTDRIFEAAKNDSRIFKASRSQIKQYQESLSEISRSYEARLLHGQNRSLQRRSYINFSSLNILVGDLMFLPSSFTQKHDGKSVILALMDSASRLVFAKNIANSSSRETIAAFEEGLRFFTSGAPAGQSYLYFLSDKGVCIYKMTIILKNIPPVHNNITSPNDLFLFFLSLKTE